MVFREVLQPQNLRISNSCQRVFLIACQRDVKKMVDGKANITVKFVQYFIGGNENLVGDCIGITTELWHDITAWGLVFCPKGIPIIG